MIGSKLGCRKAPGEVKAPINRILGTFYKELSPRERKIAGWKETANLCRISLMAVRILMIAKTPSQRTKMILLILCMSNPRCLVIDSTTVTFMAMNRADLTMMKKIIPKMLLESSCTNTTQILTSKIRHLSCALPMEVTNTK
jgi:hypothetical protein